MHCSPWGREESDPDEALGGGNQGPSAPAWARQHHRQRDPPFVPIETCLPHSPSASLILADRIKHDWDFHVMYGIKIGSLSGDTKCPQ